jgi:dynamin 1-like protein
LVAIELAYINTKHPDFHRDAELVSLMMKSAEEDEYSRQRTLRKFNVNNSIDVSICLF